MASRPRPISPHLDVYRLTLTMAMSIMHRITGIANYAGTLLLVLWLLAAAVGEAPLAAVNAFFGSWLGQVILFGYSWSLLHHMLGGIRYFMWDFILALDPAGRETLVRIQVVGSITLTLLAWSLFVWL
jgi:succinate dehydrogenase / fumarate reductase, cytochrome b subunit